MKTMTKLGFSLMLLFLVSFFTQAYAQSHNIKSIGCKYYQKPSNTGSGARVNTYEVCKVCSEKKDKEAAAKRAEDKRRADALVAKTKADNERKAKEAAEKQRLQNEKNKPVNATIVMSPNTGKETTKTKVDTKSEDLKEWDSFKDENSRPTKIGFGYYDSENQTRVITIPAKFHYQARTSSFKEGSKYTAVQITDNTKKVSPCDDDVYTSDYAIINRKGDIVVSPPNNTSYFVLQPAPFAIEFSYGEHEWGNHFYACGAKIFNIETKEVIAELTPNYILNKYGVTSKIFIDAREKMYFPNQTKFIVDDRRYASEEFVTNLQREFATGKYSVFLIYPDDIGDSSTQYAGFLLGNDGNYKILRESWLRNIQGGYR